MRRSLRSHESISKAVQVHIPIISTCTSCRQQSCCMTSQNLHSVNRVCHCTEDAQGSRLPLTFPSFTTAASNKQLFLTGLGKCRNELQVILCSSGFRPDCRQDPQTSGYELVRKDDDGSSTGFPWQNSIEPVSHCFWDPKSKKC